MASLAVTHNLKLEPRHIWDTFHGDLSLPELKNPPVENGHKQYESPDGEVDKDTCGGPKGLT